mgnify:CR=1 FL=1
MTRYNDSSKCTITLYQLSLEYEQTADALYRRITELERAGREAGQERRLQLEGRIRPLRSMYRDVRGVARQLNGYYRKYTPRRGTGLGPVDHRRR